MEYPDLTKQLRDARLAKGLLQSELAETLGVTQGMLSRYESGQAVAPLQTIIAWGNALGIKVYLGTKPTAAPQQAAA